MPSESKSQQRLMGACSHGAGWASCPKMSRDKMLEFARTPHKGLPERVGKNYARGTASVKLGDMTPLPKSLYGSDIVPAALTPKEMVLTPKQQSAVMPIPGKEHKLQPSQLKKLHAMGRRSPMKLPLPRFQFRFGGRVPDPSGAGWMRAGKVQNYQDAVNSDSDFYGGNAFFGGGMGPQVRINPTGDQAGLTRMVDQFGAAGGRYWGGLGLNNPWLNSNWGGGAPTANQPPPGTPGFGQGPTQNPSFFDSQGYPWAQPVSTSDFPTPGSHHYRPKVSS